MMPLKICIISLVLLCRPAAATPLEQCRALLKSGKYAEAQLKLEALRPRGRAEALLLLSQLQLETGRYDLAEKTARKAARGKTKAAALTLVAEAQAHAGKRQTALKTLKKVIAEYPKHLRARALLGQLYHYLGELALARSIFDQFYDDYDAEKIDASSAESLSYVAMACHYTDNYRDASDSQT